MTDVSISSINSAATIESLLSLEGLARTISQELYPQETLVTQLEAWLAAVNPAVYRPNRPWAPEVWTAYTEYKNLGEEQVARRRAFMQHCANTPTSGTPEQHLERARLAVEWGNAALRCVTNTYLPIILTLPNHTSGNLRLTSPFIGQVKPGSSLSTRTVKHIILLLPWRRTLKRVETPLRLAGVLFAKLEIITKVHIPLDHFIYGHMANSNTNTGIFLAFGRLSNPQVFQD